MDLISQHALYDLLVESLSLLEHRKMPSESLEAGHFRGDNAPVGNVRVDLEQSANHPEEKGSSEAEEGGAGSKLTPRQIKRIKRKQRRTRSNHHRHTDQEDSEDTPHRRDGDVCLQSLGDRELDGNEANNGNEEVVQRDRPDNVLEKEYQQLNEVLEKCLKISPVAIDKDSHTKPASGRVDTIKIDNRQPIKSKGNSVQQQECSSSDHSMSSKGPPQPLLNNQMDNRRKYESLRYSNINSSQHSTDDKECSQMGREKTIPSSDVYNNNNCNNNADTSINGSYATKRKQKKKKNYKFNAQNNKGANIANPPKNDQGPTRHQTAAKTLDKKEEEKKKRAPFVMIQVGVFINTF